MDHATKLTSPHLQVLLISSLLLAVASADSCSDCTAVVTTIAGRLMSDESLESQKVASRVYNDYGQNLSINSS